MAKRFLNQLQVIVGQIVEDDEEMKNGMLALLATVVFALPMPGGFATASAQATSQPGVSTPTESAALTAKKKYQWTFEGQADNTAESAWASEHRKFGDMVRAATHGQVDITYVSNAVPEREVLDAVKARKLNLGFMGVHYKPEMALMNFQSLPIVPDERLPEILALLKPQFDAIWQKRWGVKLLAFSYYLPQLLYTARPADTLEGLKSQRIRQFGPDLIKLYARAGGTPVDIPNIFLVQQNLVEGKIDGAQGALPAYVNWGWAERLKYISHWPLGSVYMALVVNLDDWNSLTPELQQKVMQAAEELEKNQRQGRQAYVESLLRQAETKYGAKVMNPPPAEVDQLMLNVNPILEDWKNEMGADSAMIFAAINKVLGTNY